MKTAPWTRHSRRLQARCLASSRAWLVLLRKRAGVLVTQASAQCRIVFYLSTSTEIAGPTSSGFEGRLKLYGIDIYGNSGADPRLRPAPSSASSAMASASIHGKSGTRPAQARGPASPDFRRNCTLWKTISAVGPRRSGELPGKTIEVSLLLVESLPGRRVPAARPWGQLKLRSRIPNRSA
jgi:hypothetical protein